MKNPYECRGEEFKNESKDCTIRAFVSLTNESYSKVHSYFEKRGRKSKKGFAILTTNLKKRGYKKGCKKGIVRVPDLCKEFGYKSKIVARSGTVNKLIKRYPKGKLYCIKSQHAFAVIDGKIQDDTSGGSIIKTAWLIEKDTPSKEVDNMEYFLRYWISQEFGKDKLLEVEN